MKFCLLSFLCIWISLGYNWAANVPSVEYLPPAKPIQEYLPPVKPSQEYLPPVPLKPGKVPPLVNPANGNDLASDGYRYKTVRRKKYYRRQRRDVSDISAPINEYLPPVKTELAPDIRSVLANDGYRYKTVRRLRYRRIRRALNDKNHYIPAAEQTELTTIMPTADPAEESAMLDSNGYAYRTVRKLKYRHRQ